LFLDFLQTVNWAVGESSLKWNLIQADMCLGNFRSPRPFQTTFIVAFPVYPVIKFMVGCRVIRNWGMEAYANL